MRPPTSLTAAPALRTVSATLCALWLLFPTAAPTGAADTRPLSAILLVARAELPDPDFAGAVVLVMNNLGPAPVGVIVNRPTSMPVSQLFPDLKLLAKLPDKVYFGGPVEFGSVWFLFRAASAPAHAIETCDGVYLSASRTLLLQLLGRNKPTDGLRIFVGHSGWGPGQLEGEIAHGDWTLKRARADAIFEGKPGRRWPAPVAAPDGGT